MKTIQFFRPFDVLILVLLIFMAFFFLINGQTLQPANPVAYVQIKGKTAYQIALDQSRFIKLHEWNPPVVLEIQPGRIRIAQNDCPGQICVHTGFIQSPAQSIVCVPKRIVIFIKDAPETGRKGTPHVVTG